MSAAAGHLEHEGPSLGVAFGDGRANGHSDGIEVDCGHPPRLPDGRDAPWHRHACQMADTLERLEVGDEELAAPERAVRTIAEPVEGDADHPGVLAVVRQASGDVRVV